MEEKKECCCCEKSTERTDNQKKTYQSRVNRIIGQLNGINKMVEENRYCGDIIIQLSAISSAVKSLADVIISDHLHTCVVRDIQNGDLQVLDEVVELFKKF